MNPTHAEFIHRIEGKGALKGFVCVLKTTQGIMSRAGKTYVVTGGASGLGEATVRRLASEGANVAILDRDEERASGIEKELGSKVKFFQMDATNEDSIKAAVDGVMARFGAIHGLINCAGVGSATTTINKKGGVHDSGIFDFVLKVNLYGTFNTSKHCAAVMAKNDPDQHGLRGIIINTSSVASIDGQKGQAAYSASKGAVNGMTLPMARDCKFDFLFPVGSSFANLENKNSRKFWDSCSYHLSRNHGHSSDAGCF